MSIKKAAILFHINAGPVNVFSLGRFKRGIVFENLLLYIKFGIWCFHRKLYKATAIQFCNGQEEGRAAEAGENPAGDFQNQSSKGQADFWIDRAEAWRLKDEGQVP